MFAKQNARPLYEQLESEKAKKEAEYDAVTKAMFAPPQVSTLVEYFLCIDPKLAFI